jgi:hypothetical protein
MNVTKLRWNRTGTLGMKEEVLHVKEMNNNDNNL